MHNMNDDEMAFASHVTKRGSVYQYVRRVPDDIRDAVATSRIQRSLRTRVKAEAYKAAAAVHDEVEKQFAFARRSKGVTIDVIPIGDWEWSDWQALADWFKADLVERDWQVRLQKLCGSSFIEGVERRKSWRDDDTLREHIALQKRLKDLSVESYADARVQFVQSTVRRFGVPISKTSPYFVRFMAACLAAEMGYLAIFFDREGGKLEEFAHPDTIIGKWKGASARIDEDRVARILGSTPGGTKKARKTLQDCLVQWEADRARANKLVSKHGRGEKQFAMQEFEKLVKVKDIGEITRAHIISYRDHLSARGDLKTPSFNKRVGQITTLLTSAKKAGWIDDDITGDIYVEVPAGTNEREPFSTKDLDRIFRYKTFSDGHRSSNAKAAGELEYWLPLISLTGGLISSEVIQLGPDSVGPHPDEPSIICYKISNAGGRSLKAFSRKRYVPVRRDLIEGGLMDVVAEARARKWEYLWADAREKPVTSISNMFSAFWSRHLRTVLEITDPNKALYSFRHNFRDALSSSGATDYEKDQLMGHAEAGTGRKYGVKKQPRVVDIRRLDGLVQGATWPWLKDVWWPGSKT